jgi:hypothetical protein
MSEAFGGNAQKWFVSGNGHKDPLVFLKAVRPDVEKIVNDVSGPKKVYLNLKCILERVDMKTGQKLSVEFNGRSKTHTVTIQLGDTYDEMTDKMLESLAKYQKEGSGWRLKSIGGLEVSVTKFEPLKGARHSALPAFLTKKKAIINMKNKDDLCFKWAVTRALNPVERDSERITKILMEQSKEYNWNNITFPTKVKDIKIWEDNNNVNVNLFGYDEEIKKVYTIRIGEQLTEAEASETINLFLHDDNHHCVVKDLSRLVASQGLSKKEHAKHICLRCLNAFGTKELLSTHEKLCLMHKLQHHVYPKPGETTSFKNYERLHEIPFAVYADFECFVNPIPTEEKDPKKSFTTKYQSHTPSGFCYTMKASTERRPSYARLSMKGRT